MHDLNVKYRHFSGFALITGLVFLMSVTVITLIVLQNTKVNYQLSSNEAFSENAFRASETGRIAIGSSVADYVYYRTWSDIALPSSLQVIDKDEDGTLDSPIDDNGGDENVYDMATLQKDMSYSWSSEELDASLDSDVYIIKTRRVLDSGAGAQQFSGYEGLGKGAGAGGGVIYFEFRSRGTGSAGANAITATDYRAKIQ